MKQVEVQYKSSVQINGKCHEDFQEVVEVFAENYDKYSEIGSSLCVVVDGEITVDVWGGYTTEQRTEQWSLEPSAFGLEHKSRSMVSLFPFES